MTVLTWYRVSSRDSCGLCVYPCSTHRVRSPRPCHGVHAHLPRQSWVWPEIWLTGSCLLSLVYYRPIFFFLPNGRFWTLEYKPPFLASHSTVTCVLLLEFWYDFTAFLNDVASTSLLSPPSIIVNFLIFAVIQTILSISTKMSTK